MTENGTRNGLDKISLKRIWLQMLANYIKFGLGDTTCWHKPFAGIDNYLCLK
jgi:hypothetical protein